MILLGTVAAAGMGLGLVIVLLAWQVPEHHDPRPGIRTRVISEPRLLRAVAATVMALLAWTVTGWVVGALVAAVLAVVLPDAWRRQRQQHDLLDRTEAIAGWTEMLRDTLAAAAGLEQAILSTAPNSPAPIRAEVTALARRLDRGERLVVALRQLAADLANPASDLVVAALVTAAQREARDLAPLLGTLARSTRAEAEMRVRVDANRARLRTAVRVVVGTLGLFAGALILFNPRYLEPYRTVTGQLVLALVAAMLAGGYLLMQRMAHLRAPERFLTRVPGQAHDGGPA